MASVEPVVVQNRLVPPRRRAGHRRVDPRRRACARGCPVAAWLGGQPFSAAPSGGAHGPQRWGRLWTASVPAKEAYGWNALWNSIELAGMGPGSEFLIQVAARRRFPFWRPGTSVALTVPSDPSLEREARVAVAERPWRQRLFCLRQGQLAGHHGEHPRESGLPQRRGPHGARIDDLDSQPSGSCPDPCARSQGAAHHPTEPHGFDHERPRRCTLDLARRRGHVHGVAQHVGPRPGVGRLHRRTSAWVLEGEWDAIHRPSKTSPRRPKSGVHPICSTWETTANGIGLPLKRRVHDVWRRLPANWPPPKSTAWCSVRRATGW